jgi:8-oxo-dGTP pyrophosphatase MutT (NUDIX family)
MSEMLQQHAADLRVAMTQRYVVGFAITPHTGRVLLLKKAKPTWQAGKYNGVGGKIEPGEWPISAMVREFHEETTFRVERLFWQRYHMERFASGAQIYFFVTTISDADMNWIVQQTAYSPEPCKDFLVRNVVNGPWVGTDECLYNIPYLVCMADTLSRTHASNRPVYP